MSDYAAFKYGSTVYPLTSPGSGASLLSVCDPTIASLLNFFSSVLTTYLGPALVGAATGLQADITSCVAEALSLDPARFGQEEQLSFPLLTVWRKSAVYDYRTVNWAEDVCKVGVAYILPPLTTHQAVKLFPALTSVGDILADRIARGFDPAFNGGTRMFGDAAGIAKCRLVSAEFVAWGGVGEGDFHAWVGELEMSRQQQPYTSDLSALAGIDTTISDQSVVPGSPIDLIVAKTP